ncbi:hypothetical protein EPO44_01635 [bacterium]|nr:MAG: hypothetical protein EPO44_01635 [bacterium]
MRPVLRPSLHIDRDRSLQESSEEGSITPADRLGRMRAGRTQNMECGPAPVNPGAGRAGGDFMYKMMWGFAMVLILIATGAVTGPSEAASKSQAVEKGASKSFTDVPGQHFQKARQDFLKKDTKDAAAEIRKSAAFLKSEAERATGETKEALTASVSELEKLADDLEKGTVTSVKTLDETFARADHALAEHHYAKASESWAKRETVRAGEDLKAAGVYLEHGLAWSGQKVESGTRDVLRDSRILAGKLIEGTGWVPDEVGKGLASVGKEIEKFGKRVELAKK